MLILEEQYMIRRLKDEGLSINAISRRTGCCRKTVRKYIYDDKIKKYKPRLLKVSTANEFSPISA